MFKTSIYCIIFLCCSLLSVSAQDSLLVGKPYLEDQLYIGFSYNNILNTNDIINQHGLSFSFESGFIKDIPLNKRRNSGLGIGIGYQYAVFKTNLLPLESDFRLVENFDQNKFETHSISIPIEYRYRTSRDNTFKFFRLYTGIKTSYAFYARTVFKDNDSSLKKNTVAHIVRWEVGPYISVGYNALNVYFFWDTFPIFDNAPQIEKIDPNKISTIKWGVQFYIL